MKRFFTFIKSIAYKEHGAEAWKNIKYLLVLGHEKYEIPHILGDEDCYLTEEFETKQEVLDYLDEEVSKNDRKHCRLYKEIKL